MFAKKRRLNLNNITFILTFELIKTYCLNNVYTFKIANEFNVEAVASFQFFIIQGVLTIILQIKNRNLLFEY